MGECLAADDLRRWGGKRSGEDGKRTKLLRRVQSLRPVGKLSCKERNEMVQSDSD
jgi:hypothetical protein